MVNMKYLGFGRIAVGNMTYRVRDIVVFPDGTVQHRKIGRWMGSHHKFGKEDIADLVTAGAQVIIIGTGRFGSAKVTEGAHRYAESSNVELVSVHSRLVGDKVNELARTGTKVGAAIHLMC